MSVYRYTPEGVNRLAATSQRLGLSLMAVALLAGLLPSILQGTTTPVSTYGLILVVILLFTFWLIRRNTRKLRSSVASTTVELTGDALTCQNGTITVTIQRDEVRQIRHLADGILVKGTSLHQTILMNNQLAGFDALAAEFEAWRPPSVVPAHSSRSIVHFLLFVVLGNLALFVGAMETQIPQIAIPLCVLEAVVLAACTAFVIRSPKMPGRLKWMMGITVFPIFGLLGRAYLLWVGAAVR